MEISGEIIPFFYLFYQRKLTFYNKEYKVYFLHIYSKITVITYLLRWSRE